MQVLWQYLSKKNSEKFDVFSLSKDYNREVIVNKVFSSVVDSNSSENNSFSIYILPISSEISDDFVVLKDIAVKYWEKNIIDMWFLVPNGYKMVVTASCKWIAITVSYELRWNRI